MNKIYKVIWSKVRNCYVAVSEIAKCNGKSCTSVNCGAKVNRGHAGVALSAAVGATLLAGVCSVLLPVRVALAAPVMPTLDFKGDPIKAASPYVTINSTTSDTTATMNISSTQTNNVLKWIDFSIGKGGTVQFDPNNYLNYVTGHGRSEIDGTLTGAGNIYLINPNGILFGSNASVDVGNLYLSTRSLTDAQLNEFANNGTNPLGTTASSAAGDIINLGRLNANNITVEGNNISFKNVEEVTPATAVNVRASGEVHVGFANDAAAATTINSTEYKTVNEPDLTNWNFKGLDNETSVMPVKYMLVRNAYELQNINNNLTGNYMLANDIDFKDENEDWIISDFKSLGSKGNNWGSRPGMFQGRLDGLNHVIRNINITNKNNESYSTDVGLIGSNAGIVENFGVVNGKIVLSSKSWVGGIVGANKACGIIRNVFFSGLVEGSSNVGGIAGAQDVKNTQDGVPLPGGIIEKAYVSGTVSSNKGSNVGGIAGSNASGASISEAYNSANVRIITGGNYTGGIAGTNSGTIINTYNTGTIEGGSYVGGIAGSNSNGKIQNTYNTGTVSGTSNLGGIVGYNSGTSPISSFFTKGNDNGKGTLISDESKLKEFATFDGTSLASNMSKTGGDGKVWRIYEGQTGPLLTAFLKTKDVITETEYNGTAQTFDENLVTGDSHITAIDDGGYATETNAGKYGGLTEGKVLYSDQLGYDLVDTKLIIQPKKLTATFGSNTYNGTAVFTGVSGTLTGVVDGDVGKVSVTATATYVDKNVGEGKAVAYSDIELSGDAVLEEAKYNYMIVKSLTGTGEITAKTLNLVSVSKEYDGTKDVEAGDIGITEADKVTGDDVNLAAGKVTGLYADKNVGTGKGVTYTVSTGALTGNDAGNYIISTAGTGDITAKAITATFSDISRVYDGGVTATENGKQLNDVVSGDDVGFATGITGAFADKNVGTNKTVTYSGISLTGNDKNNYSIAETATGKGTITAKAITATFSDISRVYDGGVTATENGKQLNDVVSGDDVGFATGITGAFADKNVGTNKTVTYSGISLTGNDKNNYSIAETATGKGTITAKAITATFSDISRVYDGGVTATENGKQLNDVVSGDDVGFATGITGAFADKNVGTNKTVTYSGISLTGNDKNNYSIAETATGKGTITAKAITATFSDISRVYDGGVTATENGKQLNDVVSGDDVGFATGITGAFADKNVGTNKTVTYSGISLTGNDKNNYSIAETATGKGTITAKAITATFSDISRVYDGGVTATENGKQLNDVVSGDDVSFATGITGAFADKNVGTNKTVTYSGIVLTGNDKNNYSIAETATGKGTITAKAITATFSDISRVYDGGVTATENGKQLNDVVSGDDVGFATGITGAFADKNVGTNKTVTYSGIVLTGNDKNNYSIAETATGKGTITAKAITATFSDISRVYDGGVTATENGKQLNDVVSGDDVSFATGITGAFADKNVGTNKTVTYSGIVLTGNDKNNYSIAETATGKGTITAKAITATFSDISRVYDGGVTATENGKQLNDVVSGDDVSFATGITGAFADKNVGTNKTVTYSGIVLTGNDKNNYSIAETATGKGTITAKAITATFSDISRVYDGGVTATENGKQLNDVVSGDDVSFATGITGAFADKNVGTNKTVTYSGIVLTGNDKNNYSIAETATGSGTITPKAITATFADISKTYDGTTNATPGLGTLSGVETVDSGKVSVSASAAYDEKNAGSRVVNYSGVALSGAEAGNYSIATTTTGAGTITPKALTATFADISKTYDGTTNATPGAGTLSGVIAADEGKVNVSASAAYDEKNAGSRVVNYTGVTLSGSEAANYSIATTATGNGSISRKALELVADSVSIQEGDSIPASFTGSVTGFAAGEGLGSGDTLLFTLADLSTTAAGSYGITGTINGSASGNYGLNYTFSNAASNANAFVIYDRPASVQDMVLSDIIPGIKGTPGADISVMALDNSLEQATDKKAEVGIEFAVAQTILSVDADRNLSLENQGMKQPPAMTA